MPLPPLPPGEKKPPSLPLPPLPSAARPVPRWICEGAAARAGAMAVAQEPRGTAVTAGRCRRPTSAAASAGAGAAEKGRWVADSREGGSATAVGADPPPVAAGEAPAWPAPFPPFWVTAPPPAVLNAKVTPIPAGPLFADAVTGADTPPPMSELGAPPAWPAWPSAPFWVTAPPPAVLNAKVTPIPAGPLFADAVTGADTPPPM